MKRTIKPMTKKEADRNINKCRDRMFILNILLVAVISIAAIIVSCWIYPDLKNMQGSFGAAFSLIVSIGLLGLVLYAYFMDVMLAVYDSNREYYMECHSVWEDQQYESEKERTYMRRLENANAVRECMNIDVE